MAGGLVTDCDKLVEDLVLAMGTASVASGDEQMHAHTSWFPHD